ncbi:MBL fold metallo-hydrolase [Asticcacaulis endophyticus]|uniref:Glyoxalase n=1 Tax=Asticcacaulis endophyticus TaxID=1395890 RepID=A0A918UX31_9CAUL|nr:MBL fold metallo-hydrolase [Asticcacaulis endophyticus]GGZ40645.1 glyoxalase [Asticcacaulis endophyticus]
MSDAPIRLFVAPVTPLQQNCTVVWCTKTNKCAVIDPGGDLEAVLGEINRRGLSVDKIWITHGHADHAGGASELKERTGATIEGPHRDDQFWIDRIPEAGQRYGVEGMRVFETDRWLENGDTVTLGETEWEVYHCPGHTPGHVVFFHRPSNFAQVGDVLFKGSIGRTDFPRGNHADLINAITTRLWPLGDVQFVPGHGPMSSFHAERQSNPYVADRVIAHSKANTSGPG